jgi:hypothetical protein
MGAVNSASPSVMLTGTRPATSSSVTWSAVPPERWIAQPTVGCPAKGISAFGVKMRTFAVCEGSSGVWTKIVSTEVELPRHGLHLRDAQPVGPSTMARGLPVKGVAVKTS